MEKLIEYRGVILFFITVLIMSFMLSNQVSRINAENHVKATISEAR